VGGKKLSEISSSTEKRRERGSSVGCRGKKGELVLRSAGMIRKRGKLIRRSGGKGGDRRISERFVVGGAISKIRLISIVEGAELGFEVGRSVLRRKRIREGKKKKGGKLHYCLQTRDSRKEKRSSEL